MVRKSYRYRGIAPRITIKKRRHRQILIEITVVNEEKKRYKLVPKKGVQRLLKTQSSTLVRNKLVIYKKDKYAQKRAKVIV